MRSGEEPSKTPHMPGAHGWNEKLASDSEASVSGGVKHCRLKRSI